jgi:hypothetical protein
MFKETNGERRAKRARVILPEDFNQASLRIVRNARISPGTLSKFYRNENAFASAKNEQCHASGLLGQHGR